MTMFRSALLFPIHSRLCQHRLRNCIRYSKTWLGSSNATKETATDITSCYRPRQLCRTSASSCFQLRLKSCVSLTAFQPVSVAESVDDCVYTSTCLKITALVEEKNEHIFSRDDEKEESLCFGRLHCIARFDQTKRVWLRALHIVPLALPLFQRSQLMRKAQHFSSFRRTQFLIRGQCEHHPCGST